jgi:hypothetical protein
MPGNWNAVEYASGDPVNFIDPTGYAKATAFAGWGTSGGAGTGAETLLGGWIEINTSPWGINFGTFGSAGYGAHFGVSAGTGIQAGVMFGGKETLQGPYASFGGSLGFGGKLGGDFLISPGKDGYLWDSATRVGFSFNVTFGVGLEGHARVGSGRLFSGGDSFSSNHSNSSSRGDYSFRNDGSSGNINLKGTNPYSN